MANVTVKGSFESLLPYLPSEAGALATALFKSLPVDVQFADNLGLYTYNGLSTTKQEVDDDAGARPLLIIVKSTGTLCWLHIYNADADNVTVGVNVDFVVPVGGTSGEYSSLLCQIGRAHV